MLQALEAFSVHFKGFKSNWFRLLQAQSVYLNFFFHLPPYAFSFFPSFLLSFLSHTLPLSFSLSLTLPLSLSVNLSFPRLTCWSRRQVVCCSWPLSMTLMTVAAPRTRWTGQAPCLKCPVPCPPSPSPLTRTSTTSALAWSRKGYCFLNLWQMVAIDLLIVLN